MHLFYLTFYFGNDNDDDDEDDGGGNNAYEACDMCELKMQLR